MLFWLVTDVIHREETVPSREKHLNTLDLEKYLKSDGLQGSDALLSVFRLRKIPVNTASPELLQTISGIGPKLAGKIVCERNANGPFTSSDNLARVPGIGPKRINQFHHHLRFD